jgi:hypothetical protein
MGMPRIRLIDSQRHVRSNSVLDSDSRSWRYDALCTLLALPEPADLPPRRHHYTYAGNAARKDRLKRELAAAYVGYRMQRHGEEATIVSVRRFALRPVRRTA